MGDRYKKNFRSENRIAFHGWVCLHLDVSIWSTSLACLCLWLKVVILVYSLLIWSSDCMIFKGAEWELVQFQELINWWKTYKLRRFIYDEIYKSFVNLFELKSNFRHVAMDGGCKGHWLVDWSIENGVWDGLVVGDFCFTFWRRLYNFRNKW